MIKKTLFTLFSAALIFQCTAADPVKAPVKTPAPVKLTPPRGEEKTNERHPALSNPDSWSMIVIPDTQTYIKQIENQGILDMMLAWIVRRREEMNIQQVLFTGDLVYYNDIGRPYQRKGVRFFRTGRLCDLVGEEQWQAASRIFSRLDGEVPYILCTGNHDYGFTSAENRNTFFNKYFPVNRNKLTRRQLVECANNSQGIKTLENSAYEFTAPRPDGRKFLVITLQFSPTDKDLAWAKKIADDPRFTDHIGILLTHSYLFGNGKRVGKEKYAVSKKGGNSGEEIFKKLVYPAKNIRLVVCGHVCKPDDWERSVGFSVDKNSAGKTVSQMVFNTQAIGGGFSGNGGDGWLRILEFLPDKKTVRATTFSPFFYGSTSTMHLAWKDDQRNCFEFVID